MTSSYRRLVAGWLALAAAPGGAAAAVSAAGGPATTATAAGAAATALVLGVGWHRLIRPVADGIEAMTASAGRMAAADDAPSPDLPDRHPPTAPTAPAGPVEGLLTPLDRHLRQLAVQARDHAAEEARLEGQLLLRGAQDPLTGLANRQRAVDDLETALAADEPVSLVLVDIDRFRLVNDTFGQRAADEVLRAVAQRVAGTVADATSGGGDGVAPDATTVARSGADEFLVVLPGADSTIADAVAAAVAAALAVPFPLDGHQVTIGARTVAVGAPPRSGDSATTPSRHVDRLLKQADHRLTMERDEPSAASVRSEVDIAPIVLMPDASGRDRSRHQLVRDAIAENRMEVWFQPIFSVTRDEHVLPTGAEALVRIRTREGELLHPADFLADVDRSDLGRKLDERVAAIALDHLNQWQQSGLTEPGFRLALNVCEVSASDVNYTTFLADQMRRFRIDPERVIVELPESAADVSPMVVERMRQLGVTVAIDDFGLASSNLDRAEDYGAGIVKLDRRWMGPSDRPIDERELEILRALVQLCGSLDVHVVAEGIENIDQLLLLLDLGVSEIQGYFLSKPLTATEFAALLTRYRNVALVVD